MITVRQTTTQIPVTKLTRGTHNIATSDDDRGLPVMLWTAYTSTPNLGKPKGTFLSNPRGEFRID